MIDLEGTTLGQYEIVELIGEGGMANVYKAWQPSLQRHVALKVLAPHLTDDANFVARFHQEAVSAANLKQTNIVTIHDVGTENGYHYIAMEFVEGGSLEDRIRAQGDLPLQQVANIILQIANALDYAHQRGFIHRDIKPANVLIDHTSRAVLTDLGIARVVSDSDVTVPFTKSGSIFGTPHYMSPEQIREEPIDHRSDLYSLGIVCYEMLSGQVPFDGTTTHSILYAQAHNPPPPLCEENPSIPPAVEAVVNKMLAKEPEARYASANAFATALAQAAAGAGQGVDADETAVLAPAPAEPIAEMVYEERQPDAPQPQHTHALARRNCLLLTLAGVLGGIIVVGAIVAAVLLVSTQESSEEILEDAQAALAGGRYDASIGGFKEALQEDVDNVAAFRGIGEAYEAQENWEQAAEWYERWTQVAPHDGNAFLALGNAHYQLDDYVRAVAAYERAAENGVDPDEVNRQLGLSHYELAWHAKAAEHLQSVVNRDPEDLPAQRTLGLSLVYLDLHDQAMDHLNKAIGLSAGKPVDEVAELYLELGEFFVEQQEYKQAVSLYEQARELDPDGRAAWANELRAKLDEAYVERAMQDVLLDLDFSNIVTEGDDTYAIARTGQRVKIEGAVHIVEGPWEGSEALVVEEGTENLIQNPSAEAEGWWSERGWNDGMAPARSAEWALRGTHSWRLGNSAVGKSGFEVNLTGLNANDDYTVSFSYGFDSDVASGGYAAFYDSGTWTNQDIAYLGAISAGQGRLTFTLTPKTHNPTLRLVFVPISSGSQFVDCIQLEHKSYATSYSDGGQGDGYLWNGPAHADTSVRMATHLMSSVANVINASEGSVSIWIEPLYASGEVVRTNPALFRWWDDWSTESLYAEFASGYSSIGFHSFINGAAQVSLNADITWEAKTWHFLVFTWSDSSNERKLYVDGVQQDSGTYSAPSISSSTMAWGWTFTDREIDSSVAMVTTFNRALTAGEVATFMHYNSSEQ